VIAALVLLLAAQAPTSSAQPVPTFSAQTALVVLDVLVTEGRVPVTGLGASDFAIQDNGVPQQVDLVLAGEVPVNAILALDVSASVEGKRLAQLKDAARAFVDSLQPVDSVTLLIFSEQIALARAAGTGDRTGLADFIASLPSGGGTALNDATFTALSLTWLSNHRSFILLLSDGMNTAGWLSRAKVLDVARESNAVVSVVTVGGSRPAAAQQFLDSLANDTGGHVISATRGDLANTFGRALTQYRARYRLRYEPTGVARSGWHELNVRLVRRKGKVHARRGYSRR
jgi:VWFA-related protein